jgi:hypothetical protein
MAYLTIMKSSCVLSYPMSPSKTLPNQPPTSAHFQVHGQGFNGYTVIQEDCVLIISTLKGTCTLMVVAPYGFVWLPMASYGSLILPAATYRSQVP